MMIHTIHAIHFFRFSHPSRYSSAPFSLRALALPARCNHDPDFASQRILPESRSVNRLLLLWHWQSFARVCRFQCSHFSRVASQKAKRLVSPCAKDADCVEQEQGGDDEAKKSKGQKKREALRAVEWGKELASLSHSQLQKAVRWASLSEEAFDAAKLAKSINPKVRSGRRRQFNYLGSLLRDVEPDMMEMVIKASKNGEEFHPPSSMQNRMPNEEDHEYT